MSRLVIHIGMPKTGSSSIQETLFAKGVHGDFRYANLGEANQGGKLLSYFSADPYVWHNHRQVGRTPDQVRAFNEAVGEALAAVKVQGGQQILSGEDLYHMDEAALTRLRDAFREAFERIEIIGYVRPPRSFIASAFVQLVKNHEQRTLDIGRFWPCYRSKLEKFDRVFGRESVTLRPFVIEKLADGDVVQDFCQLLGAPIDPAAILRVNESLSLEATAVLFAYRREGACYQPCPEKAVDNNRLVKMLSGFGSRKLRFVESLVAPIIEREAADLEWIESRLGEPLNDVGTTDAEPSIACEQDLLDVAAASRDALEAFVREQAEKVEPTPQQIANWMEKLRVIVTGRASNGVTPSPCTENSFFAQDQVRRLTGEKMGPAAALHELAMAFEWNGYREEACRCAQAASELRPDEAGLRTLCERLCRDGSPGESPGEIIKNARQLLSEGDRLRAMSLLREGMAIYENNPHIAANLALAYLHNGDRGQALSCFKMAAAHEATRVLKWVQRGVSALEQGVVSLHGVTLWVPEEVISDRVLCGLIEGGYEGRERALLLENIRSGDRVLELGAGLGFLACAATQEEPDVDYVAIEANPALIPVIRKNFEMNGCEARLVHGMAANADGVADFHVAKDFWASSSYPLDEPHVTVEVPTIEINTVVREFSPTLLMMDIEGGEEELVGKMDLSGIDRVIVELHPDLYGHAGSTRVVRELLEAEFCLDARQSGGQVMMFLRC